MLCQKNDMLRCSIHRSHSINQMSTYATGIIDDTSQISDLLCVAVTVRKHRDVWVKQVGVINRHQFLMNNSGCRYRYNYQPFGVFGEDEDENEEEDDDKKHHDVIIVALQFFDLVIGADTIA